MEFTEFSSKGIHTDFPPDEIFEQPFLERAVATGKEKFKIVCFSNTV